jgi:hypothetical protein
MRFMGRSVRRLLWKAYATQRGSSAVADGRPASGFKPKGDTEVKIVRATKRRYYLICKIVSILRSDW